MVIQAARRPDRTNPLPLWAQVLDDLRRRLDTREFDRGFPPERELIEQYGVSRHTVRDAMTRLREAGVISRERGRGTFLRPATIEQPTGALYSLFRSIEDQGFEQRSKLLARHLTHDSTIAGRLGLEPADDLVWLRRIRFADDTPIATDEVWLPAAIASPLLTVDFEHTSLYVELEKLCGVHPRSGWERMFPILPSAEERSLLGLATKQPVFLIERFTESGQGPLEWRRTIIRGDHYSFLTTWGPSADEGSGAVVVRNALPT